MTQPNSKIMKNLVSMLMFDLYADAKTIFREYVQNAYDSINRAVAEGLLSRREATIEIGIDPRDGLITIRDNGAGIPSADAARTLLSVAGSTKNGNDQAGQFGIGRLVGGGYCKKLQFRTSAKGEGVQTVVEIDTAKAWRLVKEDPTDRLATEVFDLCTVCTEEPENEDEHYFNVTLIDALTEKDPDLMDSDKIAAFLQEVAPVEFDGPFKNGPLYKGMRASAELREKIDGLKTVQLFVNGRQVKKPYGTRVDGSPKKGGEADEILNVEYFKIDDPEHGELGWGWYALTKFSTQISDTDRKRGIRLRKHNIQIGDRDALNGLWRETRSNNYFYGEFFATHKDLTPNVERRGLVLNPTTSRLQSLLREQFKEMWKLANYASRVKNLIKKMTPPSAGGELPDEARECKKIFEETGDKDAGTPLFRLREAYRGDYEEAKSRFGNGTYAAARTETISRTTTEESEDDEEEEETPAADIAVAAEPTYEKPKEEKTRWVETYEQPTPPPAPKREESARPRQTPSAPPIPSAPPAPPAPPVRPAFREATPTTARATLSENEILDIVFGCIERFGLNWKAATQLKTFIRSKLDEKRRDGRGEEAGSAD